MLPLGCPDPAVELPWSCRWVTLILSLSYPDPAIRLLWSCHVSLILPWLSGPAMFAFSSCWFWINLITVLPACCLVHLAPPSLLQRDIKVGKYASRMLVQLELSWAVMLWKVTWMWTSTLAKPNPGPVQTRQNMEFTYKNIGFATMTRQSRKLPWLPELQARLDL